MQAQVVIESLEVSPDIAMRVPFAGGGVFLLDDTGLFVIDPLTGVVTTGFSVLSLIDQPPVDVDAYDGTLEAFSIDSTAIVSTSAITSFLMRPGEVFSRNGDLLFDPVAAGLPENTDIDALSVDPVTGDLLLSVTSVMTGVPGISPVFPADLIRWDGTSFDLFFDGLMFPRSANANVDAAHVLSDGSILLSFASGIELPTIPATSVRDDDIVWFDPGTGDFPVVFSLSAKEPEWFPVDVDALFATEEFPGFTIGGSVSGLAGSGLVLRNNGVDDLPISGNGSFTFATPVPDGGSYNVTVATQPSGPAQNCTVSNGSGTVSGSNVTNVQVSCVTGGQVQFATAVAEVMEDSGPVSLTINRVGGSDGATSFRVQTASGSATSGSDFNAVNQLLNWGAGDSSSRTVNITISNDPTVEAFSEDFVVTLSRESGSATLGASAQVTVTIYDNESVIFADGFEGEP
ncbi:MAG: hypothetical protein Tsb0027_02130 [Wenzhouxiangellaceae bacterium]